MSLKSALRKFAVLSLATGGFVGFIPIAPGTAGSILGAFWAYGWANIPVWVQVLVVVCLAIIGSWACSEASRIFRKPDASYIVIDEIVGMLITMIGVPMTPYWLVWGFVLFRFFDIAKVPPADYFDQKVKSGWGVMLDDIVSGIYACGILHLMMRAAL